MSQYALLIRPSTNRVYAEASVELTRAELLAFDRGLFGGKVGEVGTRVVGGVPYVTFEGELGEDAAVLGNLSSGYALFEVVGDELLRPVLRSGAEVMDRLFGLPGAP